MSDSTERVSTDSTAKLGDSTARVDDSTARVDGGTARVDGSQGASSTGAGVVFANGQTIVLNGKNCVVESLISMGSGEAVVYKIQMDGKPFALKHYKPNTPLSDTAKNVLTKIRDNPKDRVIRIYDFGKLNEQDYEIMEYAEGGTLDHYLRKAGGIKDINKIKGVVKQLNEGLQQLHGYYKIIWQDLKPENIYFRDAVRSSLVLADFGISSVMQDGNEVVEVTASVTDLYGAPELARKGNTMTVDVSPAVAYFALGITMYELWLGEKPFKEIKATTRERRIRNKDVDLPVDMPDACKTLIRGLLDPNDKDRMGNEHIQKWLKGETLTLDNNKPVTVTGPAYKQLTFGSEVATNPKEMSALMEKYPDTGKVCLYNDKFLKESLSVAGDVSLYTEIENIIKQHGQDQGSGLIAAIYTLDPERPFISRAGKACKTNEEIADAIMAESAHYMDDLKNPNAGLYLYIAATGGSQGKEDAQNFYNFFRQYSPKRALTLVYLKLQSDGGITIGSKRYLGTDELAQEKDGAQIDLIKKAVREKDSQLLVWISDEYRDYFKSTDEFSKLSSPEQFFLLGLLPFLSFKELAGSNGEATLKDLIDNYPARSDLFEAYVKQGLPLKGSILGSAEKRTPIDYAVRNFNGLRNKHGDDTLLNLIRLLHKLGADVNEYSSDGTGPFMNALGKDDKLINLLLELGANGDFISHAGTVCKNGSGEDIANALMAESDYYKDYLKKTDANLYQYLAAIEGSQGKEVAHDFCKYFSQYSPKRALTLVFLKLQSDGGITIGSKRYFSADEVAQEKDDAQIDLIKRAVWEKDSQLLVWISDEYSDNFKSTDEFGKLSTLEQFFLLGLLPFLSFKELTGTNGEAKLKYLIDNYPARSDLFEAYVKQGLPLKGSILDSPEKKTPIDYVVCNFNKIKDGSDTVYNLIRLLHKLGADINECSSDGTYPLLNAYEAHNDDLVNLLLELGADRDKYQQLVEQRAEKERKEQEERERHAEQLRRERELQAEQLRRGRERKAEEDRIKQVYRTTQEKDVQKRQSRHKAAKYFFPSALPVIAAILFVISLALYFEDSKYYVGDTLKGDSLPIWGMILTFVLVLIPFVILHFIERDGGGFFMFLRATSMISIVVVAVFCIVDGVGINNVNPFGWIALPVTIFAFIMALVKPMGEIYVGSANTGNWSNIDTVDDMERYLKKRARKSIIITIVTVATVTVVLLTVGLIVYNSQKNSLLIPLGVTSIEDREYTRKQLVEVQIPSTVTTIGKESFKNNKLSDVEIPDSVTSIGDNAFVNNRLTTITIGANVTLGSNVFDADFDEFYTKNGSSAGTYRRPDRRSLNWSAWHNDFRYQYNDGNISITGYHGGYGYFSDYSSQAGGSGDLVIPEEISGYPVTIIGKRTFFSTYFTKVIIPNSAAIIEEEAFSGGAGLAIGYKFSDVTIGTGVTTIGSSAFANNNLSSITIPNSVTSIGVNAFSNNPVTSIRLGANVELGDVGDSGILGKGTGFNSAYANNGMRAGTYTRPNTNSTTWTRR
jgi:serine/threonine protein kinase/acetyltransferase-like isoleucine patch superfamily enzyme